MEKSPFSLSRKVHRLPIDYRPLLAVSRDRGIHDEKNPNFHNTNVLGWVIIQRNLHKYFVWLFPQFYFKIVNLSPSGQAFPILRIHTKC